jgi:WG containing repeat
MWRLVVVMFLLPLSLLLNAEPFVRFEENGKIGLKDETGKVLLPATFEALGWSDGNFSVIGQITGYQLKDRWGIINLQKQFITKADYESLTYPGGDRIIASLKTNPFTIKYGCLDLSGKTTVPFHYDGIKIVGLRAVVFIRNGPVFEYGLVDLSDKGIIPLRFRQILPIGTLRYAVENPESKTALFSEQGQQLTEFVIDSISSFHKGLAVIYQNYAQGLIDREGEVKVKPIYREVKIEDSGNVAVRDFDDWKILDGENHELQKSRVDQLEESGTDAYRITLAGRTGLADGHLKITLPLVYDYVGNEDHGNRLVGVQKHYGILRKNNSLLLPIEFDTLVLEKNFIRAAKYIGNKLAWSLYDTFGIEKTRSRYDFLGAYNGKFFPAHNRGYWGAVNRYGEEFIKCVFDSLREHKEDLLAVRFRGQFGIIDKEEKWLLAPQPHAVFLINENLFLEKRDSNTFLMNFKGDIIYFTPNPIIVEDDYLKVISPMEKEKHISFQGLEIRGPELPVGASILETGLSSEGFRGVQKDGKYGFVDSRGRLRIANRYDDIGEFHEGLAPVKLIGKWGYVSVEDKIAINPNYESVEPFVHGLALAHRNGKGGLIDKEGKTILPFRYDAISRLPDQTFLLDASLLRGLADQKGNVLIEPRFDYLQNLENGYVIVGREGKFGLLTLQGMSTVPMIYDRLVFNKDKNQYLAFRKSPWREWRN